MTKWTLPIAIWYDQHSLFAILIYFKERCNACQCYVNTCTKHVLGLMRALVCERLQRGECTCVQAKSQAQVSELLQLQVVILQDQACVICAGKHNFDAPSSDGATTTISGFGSPISGVFCVCTCGSQPYYVAAREWR